ncbi:MAG: anti-sigma factor, partial [Deltaproteobacteria bacterium]|nr:anti-sigma factor [Deltaproteobacteria bacterium]
GFLPQARRLEVEHHLATNPQEAERVRSYLKLNEALHARFDQVLDEPIGRQTKAWQESRVHTAMRYAAAIGILIAGGAIGWIARGQYIDKPSPYEDFVRQAAMAHAVYTPEVRHPVEVGADQEQHLVNWLSKRLGSELRVPHLSQLGYDLVGGRLLPGNHGPVAQFMYQDSKGQRLTLYVRTSDESSEETSFRYDRQGKVGVFFWIDGPLGYALTGDLSKPDLLRVAQAIYQQLNP